MASHKYKIVSEEGAVYASQQAGDVEVGAVVDLDLSDEQEQALVAAGWIDKAKADAKK